MTPGTRDGPDVLIVGAGAFGLATAMELGRRNRSVTVLDRGPLPHPDASSTDVSKIIRMDYGADAFYTDLAEEALRGWESWSVRWSRPLYHPVGFLVLAGRSMAPGGFEFESHRLLVERGVPVERLDAAALAARFPGWRGERFPDGYFNARAGWAASGAVVTWLARQARRAGVSVEADGAVDLLEEGGRIRGVVTAGGRRIEADLTVVAAGAWTPGLVPGLAGRMWPVGQPVLHLRVADPSRWSPPSFPVWAADIARTGWYGFPASPEGLLKIGHHGRGMRVEPPGRRGIAVEAGQHGAAEEPPSLRRAPADQAPRPGVLPAHVQPTRPDVPDAHVERCRAFLREALPDLADAPVAHRRVCFYCDTFDGAFWIDRHPDLDGLVVAAGGSGHGFKFAPVLGPVVADVIDGKPNRWAERFRWREPATGRSERTEEARYGGG